VKILLVEDDDLLCARIAKDLAERGYAVDTAQNGIDAEHLGREWPYDAVVLDLGLPQRSGLDVLKNWRAQGNAVPVLVLTARDAWHEKVDGFNAGADDYLAKPFHIEELNVRLRALIRRAHARHGGPLSACGLTLDEETQAVSYESDADPDSNVIEVYVNRLRAKLGPTRIATRRGQGYVFGDAR
jgi:DNA-binding response OmpR family regulator